jgi:DNA repair photolyase
VSVSPVIPFLNEPELERVLQAARDAGADSAFSIVLRLPWEVNPLFQHWLLEEVLHRSVQLLALGECLSPPLRSDSSSSLSSLRWCSVSLTGVFHR